jgi:hypothetical protein
MAEKVRKVLMYARTAYSIPEISLKAGISPNYTARTLRKMKRKGEVVYCVREDCPVVIPDEIYPRGERRFYALKSRSEYLDRRLRDLERKSRSYFKRVRTTSNKIRDRVRRFLPREDRKI